VAFSSFAWRGLSKSWQARAEPEELSSHQAQGCQPCPRSLSPFGLIRSGDFVDRRHPTKGVCNNWMKDEQPADRLELDQDFPSSTLALTWLWSCIARRDVIGLHHTHQLPLTKDYVLACFP